MSTPLKYYSESSDLMNFQKYIKTVPAIAICLVVLLAGFILYFILKYGVDVPYMDQWEYVGFFDHLSKGTLSFGELFKQQNEYRQFFPNVIYVALGWITHWNVRYEMIVIFLLACLVSFNIFKLASHTLNVQPWQKWTLFFIANLFIFSPGQYENWLFGVQIEYFLPIACITSAMVIIYSEMNPRVKLNLSMLLAIISTYSSINGFVIWLVLIPLFYFSGKNTAYFRKESVISTWLLGTVITLIIYFIDYHKPIHHPSLTIVFTDPILALQYFLASMGNPLRIVHSLNMIILFGGILLTGFIGLVIYIFWHYKDKKLMSQSMVWLMLAVYSLLTAGMILFGRLGYGLEQSLSSRYTSFTLFLVVAVIYLVPIILINLAEKIRFNGISKAAFAIIVTLFIVSRGIAYSYSVKELKTYHSNIQHAKAGLLYISYIPPQECVNKIYPANFIQLQIKAKILDSLGYLRPGLIKTNVLQDFESTENKSLDYGSFDKLQSINDSIYVASGYSCNPKTHDPSDAIILSYEDGKGKSLLLAFDNKDTLYWTKKFSIQQVSIKPIVINAWALDANTGKATKLKGSHSINK
ncbi:MAG: hypothetical protein WCH34_11735 [Bacteroidota bacterium]